MLPTNLAFLRIAKRAERQDDEVLQKTFVDFGSVFTALSSVDHQIVFGRRGTGKTHLLTVLRQTKRASGELAIQIDMRNLGSARVCTLIHQSPLRSVQQDFLLMCLRPFMEVYLSRQWNTMVR